MTFDFQEMTERIREGCAFWTSISPRSRQSAVAERSRSAGLHAAKLSPLLYCPSATRLQTHVHEWVLAAPAAAMDLLSFLPFCNVRLTLIAGARSAANDLVAHHLTLLGPDRIRLLDLVTRALPRERLGRADPILAREIGRPILELVDPMIEAFADLVSQPTLIPDVLLAAEAFDQEHLRHP